MPLTTGSRLGQYEIVSAIGAGGMGEVYRARDVRLQRDVAIKVLPERVAGDEERLARFAREARVLASLNHPNIAAIYGLEEDGGAHALVLEFVQGESLAARIARGPIPLKEALKIARAVADALDAAHSRGIIHRDLKPANVMVTHDAVVKVLDFGLAKGSDNRDDTDLATMTSPEVTAAGVILGTAAYMSPEQARGRAVDKRTDVWAFGCVLYEMLTGRAAFGRGTLSDSVAAVLQHDPGWALLPDTTPPNIRQLLRRCLEKDLAERRRDLGDIRMDISPDERKLLVSRSDLTTGNADLWVYDPARGTSSRFTFDAAVETRGIFSPDGREIIFVSDRASRSGLYRKAVSGNGREELVNTSEYSMTLCDWSSDGRFVLYQTPHPETGWDLWAVPLEGDRKPFPLVATSHGERQGGFSPDVRWIAYDSSESGRREIWVQPFPPTGSRWQISTTGGFSPQWRGDGKELFYVAADGKMMAVPVTLGPRFEVGAPQVLFQTMFREEAYGSYKVSPDGKRFLVNSPPDGRDARPITVVVNWTAMLRR